MRGFRSNLILLLIVYFAGFATAIYFLVPSQNIEERQCSSGASQEHWSIPDVKTDVLAKTCKVSLDKCVDFIKDMSCQAGNYIKNKLNERKSET